MIRFSLILALGTLVSQAIGQDGSRLRQAFERLDANGDLQLSVAEIDAFPRIKAHLGQEADSDGDGNLTRQEFLRAIMENMTSAADPAPLPPTDPDNAAELGPGIHIRTVTVGDDTRRYRIHVPENYAPETATPVVLIFHGGGGNPDSMVHISRMDEKSEDAGFLAVYPFGTGRELDRGLTFNGGECCGYAMFNEVDDVGFVRALLDDISSVAKVDAGAVFATGLSNGGIMSYRIAAELAGRIAAIAPVGGPLMMASIEPSRPVAVMHFHGTGDAFAPFEGGRGVRGNMDFRSVDHSIQTWVEANACDRTPVVEVLPDAVDDGTTVTRKTWRNGKDGTEVVLVEIEGGGHTWPGVQASGAAAFLGVSTRDISANDMMWEFFQKHARRAPPNGPEHAAR